MPTVLREGPYRFFFYAQDCVESPHVHVQRERFKAKLWLDPLEVGDPGSFTAHELRRIVDIVREHREKILRKWEAFCP